MKFILFITFILFNSNIYSQSQIDTLPFAKQYYLPKLSEVKKHLKDVVGFKHYILKDENQDGAWVKIVSPTEMKTNSKGKKYQKKGYVRLEYFQLDCVNEKIKSLAIFYFDNEINLEYACTDLNNNFNELGGTGPYDFLREVFNYVCKK